MARVVFAVFVFTFACACAGAQGLGPLSRESKFDPSAPAVVEPLTCSSSQKEVLRVPAPVAERAKLKAHLITLLRQSIYDDAKGIVNIAQEREIKKLADKLKHEN